MTLSKEQIEELRHELLGGGDELNALCDMALASLRAQEGVMVSVPREKLEYISKLPGSYPASAIVSMVKDVLAAPSAQNAETQDNRAPEATSETRMAPAVSAPSAEVIEMCAKVCDSRATSHATDPRSPGWATKHTEAEDCATAIRSLKSKEGGAG